MTKIFLILLLALLAPAARAEFQPFGQPAADTPQINFCASGKFFIFLGSCSPGGKMKDVISAKACGDVGTLLAD